MLVTLAAMKQYLGIDALDTTWDAFLNAQISYISDVVESYCGRKFAAADYVQTYYSSDYIGRYYKLETFHYPLISVTSITQDDLDPYETDSYRFHKPTGFITRGDGFFWGKETEIVYRAGYETIPSIIQNVVMSLVEGRYNKEKAGVDLNFGAGVQRISIPGTISIDFDYTLTSNERTNQFGAVIGDQANMLDYFRSERAIIGTGKLEYLE